ELFGMPAFLIIERESIHFIPVVGAQEGVERPIATAFTGALHEDRERPGLAALETEGELGGRKSCPTRGKPGRIQELELAAKGWLDDEGHQEVKTGTLVHLINQFGGEMFGVGQDQRALASRSEDLGGQVKKSGSRLGDGTGG